MKPDMPSLRDILQKDVDFLTSCSIIDYSLLVGELKVEIPDLRAAIA